MLFIFKLGMQVDIPVKYRRRAVAIYKFSLF